MSRSTPITDTESSQAAAQSSLNLRPLPMGELLDRAFHLYFKHFTLFIALLAVVLVPYTIVQYFQSRDAIDIMLTVFTKGLHSTQPSPADMARLSRLNGMNAWFGLQMAIAFLALPIANAAVVVAVSRAYLGLSLRFGDCYRIALQRWLSILILIIVWIVVAFIGVFGFVIVAGVSAGVLGVFAAGSHGSPVVGVFMAILFIALILATLAVGVMLYLTVAFSFVGIVLERVDPIKAFSSAFGRVFSRPQFWRSVVLAMALFGIQLAIVAVGYMTGGLLALLLKSPALYIVFVSLIQLVYAPFALLAIAVFYYDIRIRREGFDLQMLADQLAGARPATSVTPA